MRIGLIGVGRIGSLHAQTLAALPAVDGVVITDADTARARAVATDTGAEFAGSVEELLGAGIAGVVIAAPTSAHAELVRAAAAAGVAVFCEKPIASDVAGTRAVLADVAAAGIALHVGFQRRFDVGFVAVRDAVLAGKLGWLHTLRSCTSDPAPPHADYIPNSGGIFRDCAVHDFDVVRWTTGREVVEVYATGANRGEAFFGAAGDVDTAAALLTLDDGTLAVCTATRYNGAGYDVRLEACGSEGMLTAGLDDSSALRSAEGAPWPAGPAHDGFMSRFAAAYRAELAAFCEVAAGTRPSPCTGEEAVAALLVAEAADLSRRENRPVRITEVDQ
ncbi:myo-inositol 2-dehydrogenase [Longispora fulva]|uniref:Myo-inositol 2-dehydrogenase/D-chiro-inositol 1-dehydrogenase n=1 Tax=Longispora fulva TaxID=619741 RepID=A0A8J7GGX8_9ACTN|nr:Gfo/Idh/MocA family oxidoreductase [Longispora fulva]MBG6134144.1 myo-inositol 2-dehydrogenase/D-chiro-inositol 1-dehydrogenase [Longispora fulva]GIG62517.1 myo-inositol 2-dehydrogenase [Longispora fulva]